MWDTSMHPFSKASGLVLPAVFWAFLSALSASWSHRIQVLRNSFLSTELFLIPSLFCCRNQLWSGNCHIIFDTLKVPGFQRDLLGPVDSSSMLSPSSISYCRTHCHDPHSGRHLLPESLFWPRSMHPRCYLQINHLESHLWLRSPQTCLLNEAQTT